RLGNSMSFQYWRDPSLPATQAELLLSRIVYTAAFLIDGRLTVEFRYDTRPDPARRFVHGMEILSPKRLARIVTPGPAAAGETWPASAADAYVPPGAMSAPAVRRYDFTYDTSAFTSRSRLIGVQTCDPFGKCLPATTFTYSNASPSFELVSQGQINVQ